MKELAGVITPEFGKGVEPYAGAMTAGVSPIQQQAFNLASSLGGAGLGEERNLALQRMLSGQPAYDIDPAARQAAYGASEAQAMRNLGKSFGTIEERWNAMGGGRSGGLQQAMSQAAGDVSLGLGTLHSQMAYQDEMARRQAAEMAAQRQMQAIPEYASGLGMLGEFGEAQRGITGEQLGEQYQKWLMGQPYQNPWLTGFLPMALGVQATTPVTSAWGFDLPSARGGTQNWGIQAGPMYQPTQ